MAASDNRHVWDPYETSQKRHFIYRPNSPTPVLRPTTTKAFRTSYALSGPIGSTGYSEDFYWKPVVKSEPICTGTASGNRRNNPHPSQSFLVWRGPKAFKQSSVDGGSSLSPPSEDEFQNALTAQYRSTYQTDFQGIPQGTLQIPAPISCKLQVPNFTLTEMRHNYYQPRSCKELQGNVSRYGCNALHVVAPRGILPNVVYHHILNQENRTQLIHKTHVDWMGYSQAPPGSLQTLWRLPTTDTLEVKPQMFRLRSPLYNPKSSNSSANIFLRKKRRLCRNVFTKHRCLT
ncbi:hypothetical protein DPEC_G00241380 [Dallia pectoralis]|uniref:Uncharacterized protein n=1 Tax=Dallia pectoralis TaxID=75939 RepID=A0ACC2FUZ9_DALPE|nr:hypothetical protein DPEC_G00241380 [Dallia pectoralis]